LDQRNIVVLHDPACIKTTNPEVIVEEFDATPKSRPNGFDRSNLHKYRHTTCCGDE